MKRYCAFESLGLDPADFRFGIIGEESDYTYNLQVRLNAVEHPDVIEYISQFKGDARDERIKELLRLGLQANQAQVR